MLLEAAAADAYGSSFEFNKAPEVPNDLTRFGRHGSGELPAGAYTDDTMRTLANAYVLLEGGDAPFRADAYAKAYLQIRRDDGRAGWSKRFAAMLDESSDADGITFMRRLKRRPTNGCLMGAAVLGFLPDDDQVRLAATMQTISTHSPSVAVYAQVVALAAHYLLYGGSKAHAASYAVSSAEWEDDSQQRRFMDLADSAPVPEMHAPTIAASALWAIQNLDSSAEALRWSCSRGRDADSLAAATIALASVAYDMKQDLPVYLLENVDTKMGRAMLVDTDRQLRAKYTGVQPVL